MNAEVKQKWLEALRSGEYAQCKHALRDDGDDGPRYCCLGVLCNVIDPTLWDNTIYMYKDEAAISSVPRNLAAEIHLNADDQDVLIGMNDRGESFLYIADLIERTL